MSVHNHLRGFGRLNSGFWVARDNNTRSDLLGAAFHRGQTMLVQTSQGQSGFAHVVVLGNEKGGSGKSSAALHVAVALLKAGQRVATIDLDGRQQSFTRYINNRRSWACRTGLDLDLPMHSCIKLGETMQIADNESSELVQFVNAVSTVERAFDGRYAGDADQRQLSGFRRARHDRPRDVFGDRREPLCGDGAGGAAQTPPA